LSRFQVIHRKTLGSERNEILRDGCLEKISFHVDKRRDAVEREDGGGGRNPGKVLADASTA